MATHRSTDRKDNDAQLNALLNSWQTPGLPPGFTTRVTARMLEQQAKRESTFPWSPMKFAVATAAAAVIGILLGVTMPAADAVADTTDIIEQLW